MDVLSVSPNDGFVEHTNDHIHPPSQTECAGTKVKANIRRMAETTEETTQQILTTELRNVSDGVAANQPSVDKLRRNVRHSRQDRDLSPNPIRREDIPALPPAYSITTNGDPFLVLIVV